MEKLNIFISSTFYDLTYIREILDKEIQDIGHNPILHENLGIFYDPKENTHVSCIQAIEKECDILILILGSRFGGESVPEVFNHINIDDLKDKSNFKHFFQQHKKYSITQCEYLKAVEKNIPVITFVEKTVLNEKKIYEKLKKDNKVKIEDVLSFENAAHIFEFINFIDQRTENNQLIPFEKINDIIAYLKDYLSRLFKKMLTINNAFSDEEIEFIPKKLPVEKIIDYFFTDSNRKKSVQSIETHIDFNEKGHCKYEAKIKVTPIDHLTHYHYALYSDKDGKVRVDGFKILQAPTESEYFGIKKGVELRLNLFFNTPQTDEFTIVLNIWIENYLSDLFEKNEGSLHRSLTNGLKEFSSIRETITFPDTQKFKRLKIKIAKHPELSYVGRCLSCKIEDGKKIFKVKFSKKDKSNFKKDTQLDFYLKSSK